MHALRMALVGLIALTMGLAGCSGNPGDKEALGTILGAVGGGIAGSQVGKGRGKLVATGIGTLLGAAIGNEIGKSLDRADRLAMQRTTQQSLEKAKSGTTSTWKNPDSGNQGTITPKKTFRKEGRNLLPRVPADRYHRRPHRGSLRHRLPPARRNLEARLDVGIPTADGGVQNSSLSARAAPGSPLRLPLSSHRRGCFIATRAVPSHSFRAHD